MSKGKPIFSRAMQVGLFQFTSNPSQRLYVLNNHFISVPDRSIDRRKLQAGMNAKVVSVIRGKDPNALILMGGDLNTYPRPDEPDPSHPKDTLGDLYRSGLFNLNDEILRNNPSQAYTYVYHGESGTLDHLFVNQTMEKLCVNVLIPHVNADWPEHFNSTDGLGCSDHDPLVAVFKFPF